ncbi:hypothetical protein JAO76_06075 [Pontibacter sp. BT310]|uniref:Outer membrane protein beta-barrel domain-containing protein n=1 Tax=Pontibacter populi TaxID=890055 RepID=A0ABS6XAC7_9BACT|nr:MULTISPECIES: hypothetical protein [Pontibacter]MBJ6117747.1 hypothetical protein [Pontibacter sp. BT310]MBR0570173.1 hypothetical protein [Microvirga sp. STS03]MBW3364599.1 hypothetical protein [Pontibacter populi]
MKIKALLFFLILSAVSIQAYAQKYRTAAGVRFESDKVGFSIQQKVHERGTIEGIASVGAREYSSTALYEWHFPLLGERFNYYLGGGAHVGNLKDNGVFTGADAILGLEYKVNGLPFLLSADIKPAIHINHEDWIGLSSGVSVRYVIVKEKKKKNPIWPFGNGDKKDDKKKRRDKDEDKKPSIFDILKGENR